MGTLTQANLEGIDAKWQLHQHADPKSGVDGHCIAFEVDPRYLIASFDSDVRVRLGISFGHNPFTPEMAIGFLPPPVLPGEYVFGIHLIGSKGNLLAIYDEWYDSRESATCMNPEEASARARELLKAMSGDDYLRSVNEGPDDAGTLQLDAYRRIDEFEIVLSEEF